VRVALVRDKRDRTGHAVIGFATPIEPPGRGASQYLGRPPPENPIGPCDDGDLNALLSSTLDTSSLHYSAEYKPGPSARCASVRGRAAHARQTRLYTEAESRCRSAGTTTRPQMAAARPSRRPKARAVRAAALHG